MNRDVLHDSLLGICALSDAKVEKQNLTLWLAHNRLDGFLLHFHLVPGAIFDALFEKFKSEAGLLSFSSDFRANSFALILKFVLLVDVDDEFVSLQLFNIGDCLIFVEETNKFASDNVQLKHDVLVPPVLF